MKRVLWIIVFVVLVLGFTNCTKQQRAKRWGGSATIDLPANEKLVIVTWKDNNLWLLTKKMTPIDSAESYRFLEESSWGILEGNVIIVEHKTR